MNILLNILLFISRVPQKIKLSVFAIVILLVVSSCSNTKFLAKNQTLYTRTWFKWEGEKDIEKLPFKAYEVINTGYVRTNWNYFTSSRLGLTSYNYLKPKREWGIRHYFWSILSKPPVLLSSVKPEIRLKKIQKTIFDRGHFDSTVKLKLTYKGKDKKKVHATYTFDMKKSYHFSKYTYYGNSNTFDNLVQNSLKDSYIKLGDEYWLKNLKDERQRITDVLRNSGYFFFNPKFLLFETDSSIGNKKIDLALKLKTNISAYKKNIYSVKAVHVYFNSHRDSISALKLEYDSINNIYFQRQGFYKQKYINRELSLLDDTIFKLDNHNNTLSYLNQFGIFKELELNYTIDKNDTKSLIANIFINPNKVISTNLEMNFATKSNDFLGPSAILSISHANIFKGAEKLSFALEGGMEWQKNSKKREYNLGFNSFDLGAKVMLELPRFILPFKLKHYSKKNVPHTYMIIGYKFIKRVKYYEMSVAHANFGYKWLSNRNIKYKIEPLSFDFIRMLNESQEFTDYLTKYPSVARSFDEQLILGSTYSISFQKRSKHSMYKNFYNNTTVDLAGNLINLISSNQKEVSNGGSKKIFKNTYSQYFKVTNDFRYYLQLSPTKQIVTRVLLGIGVPYNGSSVLPFIKQYFAGGSNDLRAFYARTVGPGSYKKNNSNNAIFLDQSGEIKITANIEYRFPITYKLEGAFFLDAGNVWLLNKDTSRVGGKFNTRSFYKEFAVGGGFGARIDLDYLIIRLDASLPFRRPYKENDKNWTFTNPHFFSDYILSFAIGYPF